MRLSPILPFAAAVLLSACGSASNSSSSSPSSTAAASGSSSASQASVLGYEGIPLEQGPELAPASTTQTGTVDGSSCAPIEQLAYHIHAHVAVFVDGTQRSLPAGIGIPGSLTRQTPEGPVAVGGQCIYWLHTHTSDGVVHVESPVARVYTLGNFFDEWHQPLTTSQVASASGKVTAYVDGTRWLKDPRTIPLLPHAAIQLDVGTPGASFHPVSWAGTGL